MVGMSVVVMSVIVIIVIVIIVMSVVVMSVVIVTASRFFRLKILVRFKQSYTENER